ncbi:hypothetical protein M1O52_05475 [Dehalococcoidia bacterium]|nr:hypothetical protein [Dehalococcoidia bacterium]
MNIFCLDATYRHPEPYAVLRGDEIKIAVKLALAIISPGSPSILPRIDRKVCAIYDDSFREEAV